MTTKQAMLSIAAPQPANSAPLQEWLDWFIASFLPHWIEHTHDPAGFGFYDLLGENANPLQQERRTVLTQARLLFTFSHLALLTGNTAFARAARMARDSLPAFTNTPGLYSRARTANKQPTDNINDDLALSYDQSFVILGLSTWGKLNPSENVEPELEACWQAIGTNLTDNVTGLLLEHNSLTNPAHASAPPRAQNPHMHLYEAALQAYEMTQRPVWLQRAKNIRAIGLEYFYDQSSGTLIEFIAPDLSTLVARDGQRREIGHQCEWAWLLYREIELGGDPHISDIADTLLAFADNHGFASTGPMQGAAFDAVSADTRWREEDFLLWPQTEAIKTYAIRKNQGNHANNARHLMLLVFQRYFANHAAFVNQLDVTGKPIWPEALSRLHYHLVLAITEGARAGLWKTNA